MTNGDKEAVGSVKKFDKCPGCGSTERFYESILREVKPLGYFPPEVECFNFQLEEGVPVPEAKLNTMPNGAEVLSYKRVWDTCCDCGMVYSVKLVVTKAVKQIRPEIILPNRAERRRADREGMFQGNMNNPSLS